MYTIQRSILFLTIFTFLSISDVMSQQDTLPTSEIEVFKSFEARLMNAEKLYFNPTSQLPDTSNYKYSYQFRDFGLKTEPRPGTIKPLPMTFEEQPTVYNGFLRGGYGIPNAPYAEAGYSLINSRDYRYTIHARHHSFKDSDIEHKRMMDNDISFDGLYQLNKELGIRAIAGYSLDDHFLYGYNRDSLTFTDEAARRRYKELKLSAGIFKQSRKDYNLSYHGDVSFYNITSNEANKEHSLRLNLGASKKFTNEISGSLEIIPENIKYTDTIEQTLNSVEIQPELKYVGKSFSVKILPGVHFSNGQTTFLPDARLAIPVFGNAIIALAEMDGVATPNSYKNLTATNPYLHTRLDSMRFTFTRTYAMGIEGFLKGMTYKAKTGYKTFNDIAGFINNTEDRRMFLPIFDDINAVFIEGSIAGKPANFLELQFKWRKHFFTEPETQGELWHIPSQEGSLSATVIPYEMPLRLNATIIYEGRVHYLDETDYPEKTNGTMDFNIGADYFVTDRFGFYLQVNNILGTKRERWAGYEGFGINLHGGVMARF